MRSTTWASVGGPVDLSLGPHATASFNSDDLEAGNGAKGLSSGIGMGQGDWRLVLETELQVEYGGYIRTGDGFVTSMHDVVPRGRHGYHVPTFNPASNRISAAGFAS